MTGIERELAAGDEEPPSIAEKVNGLTAVEGFFTLFRDEKAGTVWLQIENWDKDFLYATGLSSGLGSNPIGLDRGQWGRSRVVRFKRVGLRVYLIEQNLRYRAVTANAAERRAVDDSFADSVIWSADIAARTGDRCLVDVKSLLIRDSHSIASRLETSNQGDFRLDALRSFTTLERCRAFPKNTELQAVVTFTSSKPGKLVRETAASGDSFSLRMHHSLVELPGPGYRPRRADPRVGSFNITFADYAAPLDKPLTQRFITRHRLHKANPKKAKSPAVKPIIYYLDPGTPQPVQDALLDGAGWWAEAFEEAGFEDAFQVRMLPPDVDPMDVRFNVIQWVHRSTRGWSYGQSVVDPRTGEIIKGHVLLGSLRVRQDRLIIDGVTAASSPEATNLCSCCGIAGSGADHAFAFLDDALSPLDVSLARLRQLSAHEVGHTLGFSHNFAASTYGDRASVMDYPAPRVKITADGRPDLSDAYGVGVGEWDRFMVRYAYATFPNPDAEARGLNDLIEDAQRRRLIYLTDADARPEGAAHPLANLWDNGSDPIAELQHVMKVRRMAMAKLGSDEGRSQADLELVLVPIYLYHRYQVAATAKLVGGFTYGYSARNEEGPAIQPVAIERQKQALDELLTTLEPDALVIPDHILALLPPKPFSSLDDRERFLTRTSMIFDPSTAAQIAAEHTLKHVLQPQRLARLAAYPRPGWSLDSVVNRVVNGIRQKAPARNQRAREVHRIVEWALVQRLIELAGSTTTSNRVRASATAALRSLAADFRSPEKADEAHRVHSAALVDRIQRFLSRPHPSATPPQTLPPPPGSPIGF